MSLPSQSELQRLFDYDASTGTLTWKVRDDVGQDWNTKYAGKPALNSKNRKGYLYGTIGDKTVRTHRVIWKLIHGVEPNKIDHINGIRHDNRIDNLRSVSTEDNQKNLKKRADNTSGHVGVGYRKKSNKYFAYINVNKKQINLGTYDTIEEAIEVRKKAEIQYNFHQNHGR